MRSGLSERFSSGDGVQGGVYKIRSNGDVQRERRSKLGIGVTQCWRLFPVRLLSLSYHQLVPSMSRSYSADAWNDQTRRRISVSSTASGSGSSTYSSEKGHSSSSGADSDFSRGPTYEKSKEKKVSCTVGRGKRVGADEGAEGTDVDRSCTRSRRVDWGSSGYGVLGQEQCEECGGCLEPVRQRGCLVERGGDLDG